MPISTQIERHADTQTNRQTGRQIDLLMAESTYVQICKNGQAGNDRDRHRQTGTYSEIDRHTNRHGRFSVVFHGQGKRHRAEIPTKRNIAIISVFLWKTLEDAEEDVDTSRIFAWKTLIHDFEIKTYIIQLMDLRLPGKCSRGVHVFHSVFQRLPQKHEYYCYVYFGTDHRLVTLTSAVNAKRGKKKKKKQAKKR